jgi:polar amino acid transport system substrate-binding protein
MATISRVYFICTLQFLIAFFSNLYAETAQNTYPHFRSIDSGAVAPQEAMSGTIRLLTDQDFAPYSYLDVNGSLVGISVELARKACLEVRLSCEIKALPFAELLPTMLRGDGDAIISGLRTTPALMEKTIMTRPYFFSFGKFLTRVGMPFEAPDIRTLAGRRIGFVKGTSHQAFLEKYYDRSALTPFDREAAMFESLRTGKLDVAFTDATHTDFWLRGTASRQCCLPLGGGFIDRTTFTRGLAFFTTHTHETLREYFDFALDRLEENGESGKIFARYLAASPF